MTQPVLEIEGVKKSFISGRVRAVDGVTLRLDLGDAVGLIGASGAGKTTLAQLIAGLTVPDEGTVRVDGREPVRRRAAGRRWLGRRVHLVFQDPYTALPAAWRVGEIVAEPLVIQRLADGAARDRAVRAALADVGLDAGDATRRVAQLSGGERQRVALARAVVARPRLLVADEPTAMLDAPTRVDLLATLAGLRDAYGLAVLHITHDVALAGAFCDRLVVLDGGRVVEEGPTGRVLARPAHPATRALLHAAATLHGSLERP